MSKEMFELADRITNHLVTLATTSMKLPLAEWGIISNDVLSAAAALRASAVAEPVYQTMTIEEPDNNPGLWMDTPKDVFEKLRLLPDIRSRVLYAHPAPAAPVPASVREVLQHALARFECLEDHFEETGDEALRAMSSVDADRMQAALASLPAPEAIDCDICRNPLQKGEDVVLRPGRGKYHRACPSPPAPEAAPSPIMQAAAKAAKTVEGWSDAKREYAERVILGSDLDDGQRGRERE